MSQAPSSGEIESRLKEFFHPLHGGLERHGLPAYGWLPEGGIDSLMENVLRPRRASGGSAKRAGETASSVGDWPVDAWRYEFVVQGGDPPSQWSTEACGDLSVVFPVLGKLLFEGMRL